MKKLFLSLLFAGLICPVFASHFSGGEIRYQFNGTNYTIYASFYKICQTSTLPLPTTIPVNFKSASLSANINRTFNLTSIDSNDIFCTTQTSSCANLSSSFISHQFGLYVDTISLATANDWVISTVNGGRAAVVNLSGGFNVYVEATLNNVAAINSNAYMANTPTLFMVAGQPLHIPLPTTDAEGDSVAVDLITPLDANAVPATYNTGYSLSAPFGTGGICGYNTATKILTVQSPIQGNFVFAIRIKEYRNGNLIASFTRDMTATVMPGTFTLTPPVATPGSAFTVYTCPGQSNTVTVSFVDSTSTDSVYLTVTPPTMSGWTFSPSTTAGLGGASATISWTTPVSMNPATLPIFYIKIKARDNGCPRTMSEYAIAVRTRPCVADSVWPGDANGDKTVNIYDPLAIAVALGKTGAARTGATSTWTAQACAPWTNFFITNNVNMKHADCSGDGTVTTSDLTAVATNYGLWHLKSTGNQQKITGLPDLYFDISGIQFKQGATVAVPIKLGNALALMNDVSGIGTRIRVDGPALASAPTVTANTSWLGNAGNTFLFTQIHSTATSDFALARTDHANVAGQGQIATLSFNIPANATIGSTITLSFEMPRIIDRDGVELFGYNVLSASANIEGTGIGKLPEVLRYVAIVPNPSGKTAELHFSLATAGRIDINVLDITGRVVWQHINEYGAGEQKLTLPANELSQGLYLLQLEGVGWQNKAVMKWVKE
jgi:hypothetical protein